MFRFANTAVAASLVFGLSTSALAWDPQNPVAKVELVQVSGDGGFNIVLVNRPALCSGNFVYGLVKPGIGGMTAEGAKNILSAAIAAKLSGKRLRTYATFIPGRQDCAIGAVELVD